MSMPMINEAQVITHPETRVWVNPSNWELQELVKRFDLRAWAGPSKFLVWDGNSPLLHDPLLDDLIEMGEVAVDFADYAAKAVISDAGSSFTQFDYWERDNNILKGKGMDMLISTETGIPLAQVNAYRPVCRGLGVQSTTGFRTEDDLRKSKHADAEAALQGMLPKDK